MAECDRDANNRAWQLRTYHANEEYRLRRINIVRRCRGQPELTHPPKKRLRSQKKEDRK